MDEMYSYGLMNYDKLNIADNQDFLNTWHEKEYYQDYLEINKEEIGNLKPVYENQKEDVHPPLYYLLLRIAATFTIDYFTKWTGICLNCVIFIGTSILVYKVAKLLFQNSIYALILCFFNGFTLISLESTMYIRMYELANFMILLVTYFQIQISQQEKVTIRILLLFMISLVLGGLTHYYFFLYAIGLCLVYLYQNIRKKNWQEVRRYLLGIGIAAGIYLAIFPFAIKHVLFSYRGVGNGETDYFQNLKEYLLLGNQEFLNGFAMNIGILAILCIFFFWKKRNREEKRNGNLGYLGIPSLIYFIVMVKNAPYIEVRYIIPIYSIITILLVHTVKSYLSIFLEEKSSIFLTTLLFLTILYSPVLTGTKIENIYGKYNSIAKKVEKWNLPIIYVFNTKENRFLDDLYLFTLADHSIVLDASQLEEEKWNQVMREMEQRQEKSESYLQEEKGEEEKGSYLLICNNGVEEEKIKTWIGKELEYVQRMNACNIYRCP